VGTLALLILLIVVWVQLVKYAWKTPTPLNLCLLAIFSALIAVSMAGDPFSLPSTIIYLWALISLVMVEQQLNLGEPSSARAQDENLGRHQYVPHP
jgi:hypothetical protein